MGTGENNLSVKNSRGLWGYGYFDTDALIEQITKQKVHEIFEGRRRGGVSRDGKPTCNSGSGTYKKSGGFDRRRYRDAEK